MHLLFSKFTFGPFFGPFFILFFNACYAIVSPPQASNVVHYAIAMISVKSECAPLKFASFNVLDHTRELPAATAEAAADSESADDSASAVTNYRIVLPANSRTAYVYSEDSIICAPGMLNAIQSVRSFVSLASKCLHWQMARETFPIRQFIFFSCTRRH